MLLSLLGGALFFYWALAAGRWLISAFKNHGDVLKKYKGLDSWALVTGATDGIGLGFVKVLAAAGFNVVLVGRSKEKLEKMIEGLQKTVKYKAIVSDAKDIKKANLEHVRSECSDLDLSIIVNNVGINHEPRRIHQLDFETIQNVVSVNCTYPTLISSYLIPALMKHNGPKGIISVSSLAALLPSAKFSLYGATKAFNRNMSQAMALDYAPMGIDVLVSEPGYVATSMSKMKASPICCTAEECATWTIKRLGSSDEVIPHWKHALSWLLGCLIFQIIPPTVRTKTINLIKMFK